MKRVWPWVSASKNQRPDINSKWRILNPWYLFGLSASTEKQVVSLHCHYQVHTEGGGGGYGGSTPPPLWIRKLFFFFACKRGWWCTMGTPTLCLENWPKNVEVEKNPAYPTGHYTHSLMICGCLKSFMFWISRRILLTTSRFLIFCRLRIFMATLCWVSWCSPTVIIMWKISMLTKHAGGVHYATATISCIAVPYTSHTETGRFLPPQKEMDSDPVSNSHIDTILNSHVDPIITTHRDT